MKKEKKQLRELSEEELKKVIGGYVQFQKIGDGDLIDNLNPDLPVVVIPLFGGSCPPGTKQSTDEKGNAVCVSTGA